MATTTANNSSRSPVQHDRTSCHIGSSGGKQGQVYLKGGYPVGHGRTDMPYHTFGICNYNRVP